MNGITKARNHLTRHPLAYAAGIVVIAWLAPLVAAVLALAAIGIYLVGPELARRQSPESQVARLEERARAAALRQIQATSAVGADLIQLQRWLAVAQQHADRWQARAERAMVAGDETEASKCLTEKRQHVARIEELRAELAKQGPTVQAMNEQVDEQLVAARELRKTGQARGLHLVIQKRRVDARRDLVMARAGLANEDETLAGMAQKLQREEDEVDALEGVLGRQREDVAARYDQAEQGEREKAELEELRRKVGMGRLALGARSG